MDNPKPSQQSSLDSLRTVEFRQTLRGYHIDDVDEYLERVAVEAEALQEQMRQANERTKQAAERIAQLEQMLAEQRDQPSVTEPEPRPAAVTDDTLQRTLLLAQKFVDQTKAEAEAQARATLAKAEESARSVMSEAEARARSITEDTERQLREEVGRLETQRTQLAEDVETIARHLEGERNRLRSALVEMLTWVDKQVQPGSSILTPAEDRPAAPGATPSPGAPGSASAQRPQPMSAGNGPNSPTAELQRAGAPQSAAGSR